MSCLLQLLTFNLPFYLMHELSIMKDLLRQLVSLSEMHGLQRVDEVEVDVGELRLMVPEIMQEIFTQISKETPLEHANLIIREIKARGRCLKCDKEFSPEITSYQCPMCHDTEVEIIQGNDIVIQSISGEKTNH